MTFEGGHRPGRHVVSALHVHPAFVTKYLLAGYPPKVAVSALVNSLKGVPARRLRAEFTERVNRASLRGHFWSPSYLAASCGGARPSITRQHLDQQQRPA
jgi:putative transposase